MLRLGLDLGTNSIGWVLYRLDDGQPPSPVELVDGGVLIHSDGRNPRSRASNAAERRSKRGPRRNRDRMLRRRQRVARRLRVCGLLPDDARARASCQSLDPLRLRAEALDRVLMPYELGRVLLSFADRRGFKSNRTTDKGEDGAIRKDVMELRRRMAEAGARTLGEYLWRRRRRGKTIRARLGNGLYPDRAMIHHELHAIRESQEQHHSSVSSGDWDEIINTLLYQIINTLLYQRPLKPVERGRCTLIPDEPRAYKAEPLFQRFRIWHEVLNIEVAPPGESYRTLKPEERELLVAKLLEVSSRTFDEVVALLGLPAGTRVNLHSIARERIQGDQTATVLRARKCFGRTGWAKLSLDQQQELVERLIDDEDAETLEDWLTDQFVLGEVAAEAVASARLPQGTGNLSRAAIERLLPYMQAGKRYPDAVKAAGFSSHSDFRGRGDRDQLPYYGEVLWRQVAGGHPEGRNEVDRYGRVANPTVHIALGQVRRLFNAITDRYGKPDEIVVELARELKQNEEQRKRYQQQQRENRIRNERLRKLATKAGHAEPSVVDMRKLRLWDEQGPPNGRVCPFTGATLSIERVLSDLTEIEHLLPYSRSLDNSMNNTVIAMRAANREKGNRTPFEAWGHDPAHYNEILARARLLPRSKQWRFEEDAMERWEMDDRFLDRQLNENSYLARLVREYLECAIAPNRIWVTPGRMTAMLRRSWGLNAILSGGDNSKKNRNDHRHHLIDAAVIGLTSRSLLQRVARMSASGQNGESVIRAVEPPWEGFRRDIGHLVEGCTVRHRPDHFRPARGRTTGRLHNETAYGIVPNREGDITRADGKVLLVERKNLDALKAPSRLDHIRDRTLRVHLKALWNHVEAKHGHEGTTVAWKRFNEHAWRDYGVRRVRVLTRLSEDSLAFVRDETGEIYKAYKTDGNAYMDIWLLPGGETRGETVSRFNAHQPDYQSRIKRDYPTARKLMRLHVDDMIAFGEGVNRQILRVKELSGERITLVAHCQAGKAKEMPLVRKRATRILKEGIRKVAVDVLGRVHDGGPFSSIGTGSSPD